MIIKLIRLHMWIMEWPTSFPIPLIHLISPRWAVKLVQTRGNSDHQKLTQTLALLATISILTLACISNELPIISPFQWLIRVNQFIVHGYTKPWLHQKKRFFFRTLTYEILDVVGPAHPRAKLHSGLRWLMWDMFVVGYLYGVHMVFNGIYMFIW
jgi:hypothetical protein